MTVSPGPGSAADPPRSQRAGQQRIFREPVEAWIRAGADLWWGVELVDLPPSTPETKAARRRAYNALRNAWMREIDHQRVPGGLPVEAEYVSHLVDENGRAWLTWGPREA